MLMDCCSSKASLWAWKTSSLHQTQVLCSLLPLTPFCRAQCQNPSFNNTPCPITVLLNLWITTLWGQISDIYVTVAKLQYEVAMK